MKKKLKVVLVLIALSLTGIIVFQTYWSINAYSVNKKTFDVSIDSAMQRALESCKKDYFDSIRVVMVRRLSDSNVVIKIDTVRSVAFQNHISPGGFSKITPANKENDAHAPLNIWISNRHSESSDPIKTSVPLYNYYKNMVGPKATVPQVLTEMSFYVPNVASYVISILSIGDMPTFQQTFSVSVTNHNAGTLPYDSIFKNATFSMPNNYRQATSLKLSKYYSAELHKINIYSPFNLILTEKPTSPQKPDPYFSETNEYNYKYNAFLLFSQHDFQPIYLRAVFQNPQYAVIKGMIFTLISSIMLILFTIFCFYYIINIINYQKKLAELKDDFINNMTHELKTPIATITVAIEGLQKFNALNDPDKTQRYLQTSRNELTRLNDLVTKVLNVAAFENNEVSLIKEKIKIDDLMNELIAAEKLKTDKEVGIIYNNTDGIEYIEVDKLHLRNVLVNIIDNAIKYSTEPVDIKIELKNIGNMARFSIRDNGMGIPPAHINYIFDKFHRVPAGNVHNVKGTGLGLSYVKYIVEAHGGQVSVTSELNAGSEFIVSIPLKNE